MRKGFLKCLAGWLASLGLAAAQEAPPFQPAQGFQYPGAPMSAPMGQPMLPGAGQPMLPGYPGAAPGMMPQPMMQPYGMMQPQPMMQPYGMMPSQPLMQPYGMMPQPMFQPRMQQPMAIYYVRPMSPPPAMWGVPSLGVQVLPASNLSFAPSAIPAPARATPDPIASMPEASDEPEAVAAPAKEKAISKEVSETIVEDSTAVKVLPRAECDDGSCKEKKKLFHKKKKDDCDVCEVKHHKKHAATDCDVVADCFEPKCEKKFYFKADYLYWQIKEQNLADPIIFAGTTPVIGAEELEYQFVHGVKGTSGWRLNDCWAWEISAFLLEQAEGNTGIGSQPDGAPELTALVRDPVTGAVTTLLVSAPGLATGAVGVTTTSQLLGGESNLLHHIVRNDCWSLSMIGGIRYVALNEDVSTTISQQALGIAGTVFDKFDTSNDFYGGQIGFQSILRKGKFYLSATGKVALGLTHQSLETVGNTITTVGGVTTATPVGTFTAGQVKRTEDELSFLPEGQLEFGYQISPGFSTHIGASFLYWDKAARPGDNFLTVSRSLLSDSQIIDSGFWAQGFNAGFTFRY